MNSNEKKSLGGRDNNEVVVGNSGWDNSQEISGVTLMFQSSTSRARVFNIALKLAALDWTDDTINKVEEMVDKRMAKLAGINNLRSSDK